MPVLYENMGRKKKKQGSRKPTIALELFKFCEMGPILGTAINRVMTVNILTISLCPKGKIILGLH